MRALSVAAMSAPGSAADPADHLAALSLADALRFDFAARRNAHQRRAGRPDVTAGRRAR